MCRCSRPSEDLNKFIHFTTVEVGTALFITQSWSLAPVLAVGFLPLALWAVPFTALSLIGALNALRFYFYYVVSTQYPAAAAAVTRALVAAPEWVKFWFPVCTASVGGTAGVWRSGFACVG